MITESQLTLLTHEQRLQDQSMWIVSQHVTKHTISVMRCAFASHPVTYVTSKAVMNTFYDIIRYVVGYKYRNYRGMPI